MENSVTGPFCGQRVSSTAAILVQLTNLRGQNAPLAQRADRRLHLLPLRLRLDDELEDLSAEQRKHRLMHPRGHVRELFDGLRLIPVLFEAAMGPENLGPHPRS